MQLRARKRADEPDGDKFHNDRNGLSFNLETFPEATWTEVAITRYPEA